MKRKLLLFTILFTCSLFAQKRAAVWYFGQNAGLSFKESTPVILNDGQLNSAEGCASISDFEGNLLFYTDGNKIWNNRHEVMLNGDSVGILSSTSTTQSSIIVPNPVDKKKYYVFTVANYGNYYGLRYSVVDMTLDNGLGAVLNPKAVLLQTPVAEKITAVKNYNGTGYWVIAHGINNSNFYAYYISSGGLAGSPVVSSVGSAHASGQGTLGYMKASPNGKYIACAVNTPGRFLEVLDFNNETGQITINTATENRKINYGSFTPYGLDFSPNSSKLYVSINSVFGSGVPASYICQYNMDLAFSELLFTAGENRLQTIYPIHGLQTAPNGKIYIAKNSQYLDVIHNPNTPFPNFNYQSEALNLGNDRMAIQGLPNFVQNYLINPKIKITDSCEGDTTVFSYQLEKPDSAIWLFNDPGSSHASSSLLIGKHKYSYPGEYLLQLIIYSGVSVDTIQHMVNILPKPLLSLGNDTVLCKGASLLLTPNLMSASYVWHDNKTISSYVVDRAGLYSVKATLKGCSAYDTLIVSYNSPSVKLTVGSEIQCLNENNFEFGMKTKGELKAVHWDFGDNSYSNQRNPSHAYGFPKEFEVVVQITDNAECIDRDTVMVKVLPPVAADFVVNNDSQCLAAQDFLFTATTAATNPSLTSLTYFFGDGTVSSLPITSHQFSKTGNYEVMLVTESANGCKDTSVVPVYLYEGPVAAFSLDQTEQCLTDNLFKVNNTSSATVSGIKSYSFDFSDGTILKEEKPAYSYVKAGEYNIELTVEDDLGCIVKANQQIQVNAAPLVAFGTKKPNVCLGTEPVNFVNSTTITSGTVTAYHWDFGDGTVSNLENPIKAFGEGKVFIVSLEAESDLGCKQSFTLPITTYEKPDADFTLQILSACEAGNSVNLINSSKIKGNQSLAYFWTVEDNNTSQTSISGYSFKKAGKHTVTLRAVSPKGCADTSVQVVEIYPQPNVQIQMNNRSQCLADNSFSPQADVNIISGSINHLLWTLSDGRNFTGNYPKFAFTDNGEYSLKLIATSDKGCTSEKDIELEVFAQPKADFTVSDICLNERLMPINKSSIDAGSIIGYSWEMGDNTVITGRTGDHKYAASGSYTVDLTIISDEGCKSRKAQTVVVKEIPQVDFTSQRSGWENQNTMYEFVASDYVPGNTYSWKINTDPVGKGHNIRLPFSDTGMFKVSLEVMGSNLCSASKEKEIFVVPPFYIEFPNTFTPNEDGLNDLFGPIGAEYHRSYEMIIYNRWGSILFHTYDPSHHWGGYFFEREAPTGVYYYYVKVVDHDGIEREFSNSLLLMR